MDEDVYDPSWFQSACYQRQAIPFHRCLHPLRQMCGGLSVEERHPGKWSPEMERQLHDVHELLPPLSRERHPIRQNYSGEGTVLFWEKLIS